ncbi:MAG: hypothetical protein WAZ18_04695 [Alphaproteobacteria bacterium]
MFRNFARAASVLIPLMVPSCTAKGQDIPPHVCPEILRQGKLLLDFTNPKTFDPKRLQGQLDMLEMLDICPSEMEELQKLLDDARKHDTPTQRGHG